MDDAGKKARKRGRRKLSQTNADIDPETLQAGITLAGYHIEKGARSFSAYAKAMIADLGEGVRPYLKSWYMGVKYDPRAAGFDGMSTAADVEGADHQTVGLEEEVNLQNWISQARAHWKEFQPKRFKALQKNGKLNEALKAAAEQTHREMTQLEAAGYREHEAWEMVREQYLFPPEEKTKEQPVATGGVRDFMELTSLTSQALRAMVSGE